MVGTATSQPGSSHRRSATTPTPATMSSSPVQVKNQDSRCRLSSSYDRVSRDP